MALATRCPRCDTVFRISTAQAAAKGGMVRCGICANVFNSLDALVRVEELDVIEEVIVAAHDAAPARGMVPEFSSAVSFDATPDPQSGDEDGTLARGSEPPATSTGTAAPPAIAADAPVETSTTPAPAPVATADEAVDPEPVEADAPATPSSSIASRAAEPAAFEEPSPPAPAPASLRARTGAPGPAAATRPPREREPGRVEPVLGEPSEDLVIREWWMPEDAPAERPPLSGPITSPYSGRLAESGDSPSSLSGARRDDVRSTTRSESRLDARFDSRLETHLDNPPAGGTNPVFMRPEAEAEPGSRAMRWILGTLSLVAFVALLAQCAYLWRDELAAYWSPARPWLAAACQRLDCELGYPVHADAITIESATVQSSGPNTNLYVLSALLRNRDTVNLRYPHLELVLTDLQDRPILRRDLRPEDYLGAGLSPQAGFAAQSELPVRLTFELDNLRFAGYRLNQFYP